MGAGQLLCIGRKADTTRNECVVWNLAPATLHSVLLGIHSGLAVVTVCCVLSLSEMGGGLYEYGVYPEHIQVFCIPFPPWVLHTLITLAFVLHRTILRT